MCNTLSIENVEHLLMHCPYFNDRREAMLREIKELENYYDTLILTPMGINLPTMLGRITDHSEPEVMLYFYRIIAINVQYTYVCDNCKNERRCWVVHQRVNYL